MDPFLLALLNQSIAEQLAASARPAPPPGDNIGTADLASLAKKRPPASVKMTGSAKQGPEVVWNADKTKWRYPASNAWRPASEQPK